MWGWLFTTQLPGGITAFEALAGGLKLSQDTGYAQVDPLGTAPHPNTYSQQLYSRSEVLSLGLRQAQLIPQAIANGARALPQIAQQIYQPVRDLGGAVPLPFGGFLAAGGIGAGVAANNIVPFVAAPGVAASTLGSLGLAFLAGYGIGSLGVRLWDWLNSRPGAATSGVFEGEGYTIGNVTGLYDPVGVNLWTFVADCVYHNNPTCENPGTFRVERSWYTSGGQHLSLYVGAPGPGPCPGVPQQWDSQIRLSSSAYVEGPPEGTQTYLQTGGSRSFSVSISVQALNPANAAPYPPRPGTGTIPETAPRVPTPAPLIEPLAIPTPSRPPAVEPITEPTPEPSTAPETPGRPGTAPAVPETAPKPGVAPVSPGAPGIPALPPPLKSPTQIDNGAIVPAPGPSKPPTTKPGTTIVGSYPLPDNGPRPTPEAIATELGKIEKKLEILLRPPANQPDWMEKLGAIYALLNSMMDSATYTLGGPCEQDENGDPVPFDDTVQEWEIGGSLTPFGGLEKRLDAIAEMLQYHKLLRQPSCKGPKNVGSFVTVNFEQIE